MQHNSSQPPRSNLSIKNDSYDNSFNLFKQAVAERRANNIVAKMMERNNSLFFSSNLPLKIIQIVIDSNHLKILLLREELLKKRKIMLRHEQMHKLKCAMKTQYINNKYLKYLML